MFSCPPAASRLLGPSEETRRPRSCVSGLTRLAPNCERAADCGEFCEAAGAFGQSLIAVLFGDRMAGAAFVRSSALGKTRTEQNRIRDN
jgi:hypothetical protein